MIWRDEYALGIPEIDDQHETLLEYITEFEKAVDGKAHWSTVQPLISRARECARFHFAVEESLMQIVGYPRFVAHRAEHQHVLEQFAILEQRIQREDMKGELLAMVRPWLYHHNIESDKPFARFAIGRRSEPGHANAK